VILGGTGGTTGAKGGVSDSANTGGKGGVSASAASGGTAGATSASRSGTGSGGATPVGGTSAASEALDKVLAPLITSFCAAVRHCCSLAEISTTPLVDCEAQFLTRNPYFGVVDLGQATIDSKVFATCKTAYDEAASSCSANALPSACSGMLVAKQAENAPCGRGGSPMISGAGACDHSAGAMVCAWTGLKSDPAVTGTCRKVVHGKKDDTCLFTCFEGEECSFTADGDPRDASTALCFEEEGFFCSSGPGGSRCQPFVAQGGSCSADPGACRSTDYCDPVSKICKAANALGQSCLDLGCQRVLICGADKKCAEYPYKLAREYETCEGYIRRY
jgi:hypothetical protein